MEITKIVEMEIAHRLPDHPGKCRFIHGHTYKIEVTVLGELNKTGMVKDFKDLKDVINELSDRWDHSLMLFDDDPLFNKLWVMDELHIEAVPFIPTAENMARYIAGFVQGRIKEKVQKVKVWETSNSHATWRMGNA